MNISKKKLGILVEYELKEKHLFNWLNHIMTQWYGYG
jgi:hypothetical protein